MIYEKREASSPGFQTTGHLLHIFIALIIVATFCCACDRRYKAVEKKTGNAAKYDQKAKDEADEANAMLNDLQNKLDGEQTRIDELRGATERIGGRSSDGTNIVTLAGKMNAATMTDGENMVEPSGKIFTTENETEKNKEEDKSTSMILLSALVVLALICLCFGRLGVVIFLVLLGLLVVGGAIVSIFQ